MKKVKLGDYLLWDRQPAKIVAETDNRQVLVELLEHCKCHKCGANLGPHQIWVIPSSPLFQSLATKMETIIED